MRREEEIAGKGKFVDDDIDGANIGLRRDAHVGKNYEKGADDNKDTQAFNDKGRPARFLDDEPQNKGKESYDAINKDSIHIHHRHVVQYDVSDGVAGLDSGVGAGEVINNQTDKK